MTSRIIVNNIQSDTGVSSVTFGSPILAPTFIGNVNATSGVTTVTQLNVGSGTSTGTASQPLQVTGGAYVSGKLGVGLTNPAAGSIDIHSRYIAIDTDGGYLGGQVYYDGAWKNLVSNQGGYAIRNTGGNFTVWSGTSPGNAGASFSVFAERMRVDGSGRVTKPYQPFVSVTKKNGNPSGIDVLIIFDTVDVNIGSHYSTTTGLFTCPVAGSYRITIHGHTEGTTGNHGLSPLKNGTLQNGGSYSNFGSATWVSHISDTILSCAANDTLSARCRYGTFWGGNSPEAVTMTIQLLG